MYKTKFNSYKQCLCGLLFYRNVKRIHTDQSILHFFTFSPKRKDPQTFKCSRNNKSFLQCVCYWYDLLECFLFYMITERHYFLKRFVGTLRAFPTTMLLRSLKEVFRKRSDFNVSPQ